MDIKSIFYNLSHIALFGCRVTNLFIKRMHTYMISALSSPVHTIYAYVIV